MDLWSDIPANLLMDIEKHLESSNSLETDFGFCIDKIRLRCVCVSWRNKLSEIHTYHQYPLLLQALHDTKDASHKLIRPTDKVFYKIDLPQAQGRLFKGSSYGWLATIDDTSASPSPAIYLLNPLTKFQIKLPPRNKFPDIISYRPDKIGTEYRVRSKYFGGSCFLDSLHVNTHLIDKIVLSSSPSRDDYCLAVAIYGEYGDLAYCRCKDKKWTALCDYRQSYSDVLFSKGNLYALGCDGTLFLVENIGLNAKMTKVASPPQRVFCDLYLVESSSTGELIMVERLARPIPKQGFPIEQCMFQAIRFRVYKHDQDNSCWFLVTDLGMDILFVGQNSSFSISSSSPEFSDFERNCIYFTDNLSDYHYRGVKGGADIGVYNLKTKIITPFYDNCNYLWPPPVWVTPSPYKN